MERSEELFGNKSEGTVPVMILQPQGTCPVAVIGVGNEGVSGVKCNFQKESRRIRSSLYG